ncbi:MAG TPA: DUF4297 domain-containing protein [Terracidiphilus sp.]
MDLKTRLLNTPPRDLSGATTSDRFEYQRTWALCHLLELHVSEQDYVVIFDHHEDVSVLDSEEQPTSLKGYQIKTKDDGGFTVKALLKREPGAGNQPKQLPSILGKLYDLKLRFPQDVKLLAVVSNASFSLRLRIDGKKHPEVNCVEFADLHQDHRKMIMDGLEAELSTQEPIILDGLLAFSKSDIPLRDHETYARGRLAEFLQKLFPDRKFSIIPLFRALLSEVSVRNNNHEENTSYADLLVHKALSRRRFTEVLKEAGVSAVRVDWLEVLQRLNTEGFPFKQVSSMRREWDAVQLDRLTKRDIPFLRLREAVREAVDLHLGEPRLVDQIYLSYENVAPRLRKEWGFSEAYVKAWIVLEAYEHQ